MTKEELKQYIDENVYENVEGDITGESLNAVLKAIVDDGGTEVEANPKGEPTETLGKLKIGETIYTAPQGPQGEPGQNAVNPFKGWYTSTASLPANPVVGDYAFVKGASSTDPAAIYECTTEGTWSDSGRTADTSNVQTFESGEEVNETYIDDTHLVNPKDSALPKAEDVMRLKVKLEGVTEEETKVQLVSGQNVFNGEALCKSTSVDSLPRIYIPNTNPSQYKYLVIDVRGYKRIRFFGLLGRNASIDAGYQFYDSTNYSAGASSADNGFLRNNTGAISYYQYDFDMTLEATSLKEYVVEIPEGAVYFKTCVKIGPLTEENFYCYLQKGQSVDDRFDEITGFEKKISTNITRIDNKYWQQSSKYCFGPTIDLSSIAYSYDSSGAHYRNMNTVYSNFGTYFRGKKIQVTAGAKEAYLTFMSMAIDITEDKTLQQLLDGGFLSSVHTNCAVFVIPANSRQVFDVPDDCARIILSKYFAPDEAYSVNRYPSRIDLIDEEQQKGLIDDTIDTVLYGEYHDVEVSSLGKIRKGSFDPDKFYSSPTKNTLYEIPLEGCKDVTITDSGEYYIIFVSKTKLPQSGTYSASTMRSNYMATCDGFAPEGTAYRIYVNPGNNKKLTFNAECKYLYLSKYYSGEDRTPSSVVFTKSERYGGALRESDSNSVALGLTFIENENTHKLICKTTPIHLLKGVYISVNAPYRVTNAVLLDHLTKSVVNDDYRTFSPNGAINPIYARTSTMNNIPALDVVYQIERIDGDSFESVEGLVDEFVYVNDLFTRKLPDNIDPSIYYAFKKKLQTSIGALWTPSRKVPHSGGDSATRFRGGVTYFGVNYSGPTQWGKHVGLQVSMRTFMTALANPRSVMYTERIGEYNGAVTASKYGYVHESYGREAGAFYGCVCTGLTSYLVGLNQVFQSSLWRFTKTKEDGRHTGSNWAKETFTPIMGGDIMQGGVKPMIWTFTGDDSELDNAYVDGYDYDNPEDCQELATLLQPMDFVWKEGHCAVISDIYKNEYGDVKYIVISEQTTPTSASQAYTPEYFFLRFWNNVAAQSVSDRAPWAVLRKKSWTLAEAKIPRKGQDEDFVIMDEAHYNPVDMAKVDEDIMTFAGEYASFVIGDYSDNTNDYKMYLNIHRGGTAGYTHLQIFNENDEDLAIPVADIDITQNGGNVAQSNIIATDEQDDWIIYNLASYWLVNLSDTVGKYKARVVNKNNGDASGYTHFEMVKITINEGNGYTYEVTGALPVVYRAERANGNYVGSGRYKDLSENDYTYDEETDTYNGDCVVDGWTGDYLRLFAKTDYGMVNVRIALN